MDMQNPQMMAMAQAMMQDPEIMQMMQQPGMMEKIQGAMANPASAMGDPDVMKIVMKLQSLGGGGMGGGGMGGMGGGGGYSPPPAAAAAGGSGTANIQHITTPDQLAKLLTAAGPKLVVIDYFTTWCGPCKMIAPLFQELAARYDGKVIFVKVDGDKSRDLVLQQGVSGFPTFEFYVSGQKIENFSGADQTKLRQIVEQYGEYLPAAAPCPYKHFPLQEKEQVKYADMKWELVAPKFAETSAKFAASAIPAEQAYILTDVELKTMDSLISIIQTKSSYHTSSISAAQFELMNDLLIRRWPKEVLAPLVNTIRMAVFHPDVAQKYAAESNNKGKNDLISPLLKLAMASDKSVLSLLCVRTLVNGFSRRVFAKALAARFEEVLESLASLARKWNQDDNIKLAIVAMYINYAILFSEDSKFYEQAKVLLLTSVQECLQQEPFDPKLCYRCCVILGTLIYSDANATELARDLDIFDAVKAAAKSQTCVQDQPMQQVAAEIEQALKAK